MTRRGSSDKWRQWADWMLGKRSKAFPYPHLDGQTEDTVGVTMFFCSFDEDASGGMTGTVAERALFAYFLAEAGEPF